MPVVREGSVVLAARIGELLAKAALADRLAGFRAKVTLWLRPTWTEGHVVTKLATATRSRAAKASVHARTGIFATLETTGH